MRPEDKIVIQISQYLNYQYPQIIYHFDVGSGGVKSIGMAMRDKRINTWRGYPDLFLPEPRGCYHGLFAEIKKDGTKIINGKGNFTTPHIEEQNKFLESLRIKGYWARFSIGFEETKKMIDEYLKL